MAHTPPPLDSTVGGVDSNAYVTVAEADAHIGELHHHDEWDSIPTATEAEIKTRCIIQATYLLDMLFWNGAIASDTQRLRWPRDGMYDADGRAIDDDVLPELLKHATAEMAFAIIKEDRFEEAGTEGFSKIKVDVIELQIDNSDRRGIVPKPIIKMLRPFLKSYSGLNGKVGRV